MVNLIKGNPFLNTKYWKYILLKLVYFLMKVKFMAPVYFSI